MIYKAEEKFHSHYQGKCNHNLCAQKLNCQIDELAWALNLTQALPLSLLPNKKWEGQEYFNFYSKVMSFGLFLHIFGLKQARENHKNACRCGSSLGSKSSKRQAVWKRNYSRNETVSCGYLEISYHIDAKRYRVAGYLRISRYTDANVAAK